MIISKDLQQVDSVYEDEIFSKMEDYWFSYKRSPESIYHFFRNKILLPYEPLSIYFSDIKEVSLVVPNIRLAASCAVRLTGSFGEVLIPVDTVSSEKYLDVFPLQKAIARQMLMAGGLR